MYALTAVHNWVYTNSNPELLKVGKLEVDDNNNFKGTGMDNDDGGNGNARHNKIAKLM